MRDKMYLGTVPCNESCEQLGPNYNSVRARLEARTYIEQIVRTCGDPPDSAQFSVVSCPHDFGNYYEVVLNFDRTNKNEVDYFYRVDESVPSVWDLESKQKLSL